MERRSMRCCGPYFRSATSVCPVFSVFFVYCARCGGKVLMWMMAGSRYVYDMYYEKEAISKQLYEWLLKNGYADANLIAKWKKQGYEKVPLRG